VQDTARNIERLKVDLVILAIISAGNDYLPPVRGGILNDKGSHSSLWSTYKSLRAKREFAHECAAHFPVTPFPLPLHHTFPAKALI
jgi:hypothetical protein